MKSRAAKVTAVNVKRAMGSGKRAAANTERDCHRKFIRLGFSLPIAIRPVTHEIEKDQYTSEWAKVSDWLACFLNRMPSVLGCSKVPLGDQCKAFWTMYQHLHPSHVLYPSDRSWSRAVPICLYGDEGRGPKRANFLDVSWETPLGVFDHKVYKCNCAEHVAAVPRHALPVNERPVQVSSLCHIAQLMSTNQQAHSYLTKHLIFGLPSYIYRKHEHVLEVHLELLKSDMEHLFTQGVKVGPNDDVWYGVLVGIKGDMKFHAEVAGQFTRCYSTLGKKKELHMCAWCLAGPKHCPFEEIDHDPKWVSTMFAERPWNDEPSLAQIPMDASRPEYAFKFDMFHLMKVGMSRDIVGSLIVVLARLGFFDFSARESRDLPERLERAHGHFRLFCAEQKKSPGLRSFTKTFFNCKTYAAAPWSNSKGSDTTLLVRWLTFFIGLAIDSDDKGVRDFLQVAKQVLVNVAEAHRICETHGLWMPRSCGQSLYVRLMVVCKGYHRLAAFGLGFAMISFGLKPKYHGIKHVVQELRAQLRCGAPLIANPNIFCCESNEDHVGKISALSRRLSTRTLCRRLLQRVFLKTKALMTRHADKHGKGLL